MKTTKIAQLLHLYTLIISWIIIIFFLLSKLLVSGWWWWLIIISFFLRRTRNMTRCIFFFINHHLVSYNYFSINLLLLHFRCAHHEIHDVVKSYLSNDPLFPNFWLFFFYNVSMLLFLLAMCLPTLNYSVQVFYCFLTRGKL